ncbi:hypothetical protein GCM10010872_23450 [Dyella flava]|nr:hypothetical protein GCM10010872_23450 [Dyella flava]
MGILNFEAVRELGLSLSGVVDSTVYGSPALKLGTRLLACVPTNKTAEVNSVVVYIDFERRAQLLEQSPEIYYITDHYEPHPTVLVRLSKIKPAELSRLLRDAYTFVSSATISRTRSSKKQAKPAVRKAVVTKSARKR